ncbi:hypothetical protein CHELA20_52450 [Hyphomicrobiales bacterium]|nr:hypothetical protein CHELA41_22471 [Hyphomicrobiales bacterium]CAH1681909.1 hypothetical protein CHELA20_52450 [Hyphomicrobiales bacterium]
MGSILGSRGRQRKGVQHPAHAALKRGIDHLMLLQAAFALEGGRYHRRGIVIPVPRQVTDLDDGIGNMGLYQHLDVVGIHCHGLSDPLDVAVQVETLPAM